MFNNITLILNPNSGSYKVSNYDSFREKVINFCELTNLNLAINITEYSGFAFELCKYMKDSDDTLFVIIGGDGTVHEVVNGLYLNKNITNYAITVCPIGSGNNFSKMIGINSIDDCSDES